MILIRTKTQLTHFWGNPLYQATKRHLTVKWLKTMRSTGQENNAVQPKTNK